MWYNTYMSERQGAGKGDRYRNVDQKKWSVNWEKVFNKKKKKKKNKVRKK